MSISLSLEEAKTLQAQKYFSCINEAKTEIRGLVNTHVVTAYLCTMPYQELKHAEIAITHSTLDLEENGCEIVKWIRDEIYPIYHCFREDVILICNFKYSQIRVENTNVHSN